MVTEAHQRIRPQLVAEMFFELKANRLGKTLIEKPNGRDVERVDELMRSGVSFFEAKQVLRWLFTTTAGEHEAAELATIVDLVNRWPALQIRVDKHIGWPATAAAAADSDAAVGPRNVGADHIARVQAAGLEAAGFDDAPTAEVVDVAAARARLRRVPNAQIGTGSVGSSPTPTPEESP